MKSLPAEPQQALDVARSTPGRSAAFTLGRLGRAWHRVREGRVQRRPLGLAAESGTPAAGAADPVRRTGPVGYSGLLEVGAEVVVHAVRARLGREEVDQQRTLLAGEVRDEPGGEPDRQIRAAAIDAREHPPVRLLADIEVAERMQVEQRRPQVARIVRLVREVRREARRERQDVHRVRIVGRVRDRVEERCEVRARLRSVVARDGLDGLWEVAPVIDDADRREFGEDAGHSALVRPDRLGPLRIVDADDPGNDVEGDEVASERLDVERSRAVEDRPGDPLDRDRVESLALAVHERERVERACRPQHDTGRVLAVTAAAADLLVERGEVGRR